MPSPVLIDAAWWVGGNRRRGIGAYLESFFQKYCPHPRSTRVWVLPPGSSQEQGVQLSTLLGGEFCILPTDTSFVQQAFLEKLLREKRFDTVFFSSPFERPFSLLDFAAFFHEKNVRTEAIVFDLLPLQYPTRILALWSIEDQLLYRSRVQALRDLHFLWTISPATQRAVHEELSVPLSRTKVLRFGMKTDWIIVPQLPEIPRDPNLVVSISGGEWRKNIEGTLETFANGFPHSSRLIVICRLGRKHQLALYLKAWRLGILNRVRFVGEISEEEKWKLLKQASTFLFLSHAEGLGIPLLEAEKAGVPRILVSKALVKAGLGVLVTHPEVV